MVNKVTLPGGELMNQCGFCDRNQRNNMATRATCGLYYSSGMFMVQKGHTYVEVKIEGYNFAILAVK